MYTHSATIAVYFGNIYP